MLPLLRRSPAPRVVNVPSEAGSNRVDDQLGQPAVGHGRVGDLPGVQGRAEHGDRHVRQGAAGHPAKVNAAHPGYCATDLNGHQEFRTPEQGAQVVAHLATLPADGPSGLLWGHL
jgi:hypothetical protein